MAKILIGLFVAIISIMLFLKVWRWDSDEKICIMPYQDYWAIWYQQESSVLINLFKKERLIDIQHFGSTSIRGMHAKPVVDILIGLDEFYISPQEVTLLNKAGYIFVEKSSYCDRFYFKKQGKRNFNLSIVLYKNPVWVSCIATKYYLLTHPLVKNEYIKIKKRAIQEGFTTLKTYSQYKRNFIKKLSRDSEKWYQKSFVDTISQ